MEARSFTFRSCLNPSHWLISRKIAAGPVIMLGLLCLFIFLGWSIADRHQRLIEDTYEKYVAFEEAAHRLPHMLGKVQKRISKSSPYGQDTGGYAWRADRCHQYSGGWLNLYHSSARTRSDV